MKSWFLYYLNAIGKLVYFFLCKASWFPLLVGTILVSYISIPSQLRARVNNFAPDYIKDYVLAHVSYNSFLIFLFFVSISFLLVGNIGSNVDASVSRRRLKLIKRENEELKTNNEKILVDCYDVFSTFIKGYYVRLNMGPDERASLYKYDAGSFLCIGRYSNNEFYRRNPKNIYPANKGIIKRAWRQNTFEDASAPDPNVNIGKYIRYQVETYGYDEGAIEGMRMKSRSYYAIRIKKLDTNSVAVLLFESTQPNGLKFGKIRKHITLEEQRKLGALIGALENHMPSLDVAEKEGF